MRKVFMIGDSLMQDYNALSYPQFGFGQMIKPFILDDVMFLNLSKAGRSTKSFIDQKRFDDILKIIEEGDLLIVEFGNNDEKVDDLSRYTDKDTTFLSNLNYFYTSTKEKGADCIFITSPTRNEFDEQGHIIDTHKGYPKAMYDWCQKNNYLCYELNEESKRIYNFCILEVY